MANELVVLDYRHPAFEELWETLGSLGITRFLKTRFAVPTQGLTVDHERPLGHSNRHAFPILVQIARAAKPVSFDVLRNAVSGASSTELRIAVAQLKKARVVDNVADSYGLNSLVPGAFVRLILKTADYLARRDDRYRDRAPCEMKPLFGSTRNSDGAPRLFGPDRRLRLLMALAVNGPMHLADLRRAVSVEAVASESHGRAPFGRGAVVRVWKSPTGLAAGLDPDFPAAHELRRLLVRLESSYKLPTIRPRLNAPKMPRGRPWDGDRHSLFWGPLNTSILMTIASIGWGFEALFVRSAPGYARRSVKNAARRLEEEGVTIADKSRKPGFAPRIVRLSPAFCGYDELQALLARCLTAWPAFENRAQAALRLSPGKTRAYLRSRGLLGDNDCAKDCRLGKPGAISNGVRAECLREYWALCDANGAFLTAHDLVSSGSPGLYKRILANWGGMAAFREAAGVPARLLVGTKDSPEPALRDRCLREYRSLAERMGSNPNSLELKKCCSRLYEHIIISFGSFPAFYDEANCAPRRRRRDPAWGTAAVKANCAARYRAIEAILGYEPSSTEVGMGLQKQIYMAWGCFPSFLAEIGALRSRLRAFSSLAERRTYCIAQYAEVQRKIGHAPSSFELLKQDPALLQHIRNGWGGFIPFCLQTRLRQPRLCANQLLLQH